MENQRIKEQTETLVAKVKKEESDKEYMVDRRMINTFLITYLSKQNDRAIQQRMLQAMSKILDFTEEEKK
jgi:hypothetical protein